LPELLRGSSKPATLWLGVERFRRKVLSIREDSRTHLITVSVAIEIWKYVTGKWTLPLVAANVAMNMAFVGFVVALLRTQQVVNPAYVSALEAQVGESLPAAAAGLVLVLVVVGIAVWDSVDGVLKYLRGRRAQRPGILSER